ncbi:MAG: DUF2219 family protein [Bacteroides sp.]|nr:DUF2219 family protein [Bacteroides sp.]
MRHASLLIILSFASCGLHVLGAESRSLDQHISFAWENDLYYQRDYYYTNGFQIEFFHDKLQKSPINWILIPTGKKNEWLRYSGLQLRQEIFTPKDLAADSISAGDHPYSSTLTLSQISIVNMPDRLMRFVSELRLGVMGPASLGFKTQELGHSVSNPSRPPKGWDYQLQNDFIINYDIQIEKGIFSKDLASFGFKGKSRLGTLHTDLEAGLWFLLDARKGYFNRFGPSGEPGLNVVFKLSAGARYIFYDATLQGGVFNKTSPYVIPSDNLSRWIGNIDLSLTFELLAHQLEFYTQIASPRFHLAAPHGWMGIAYKYWF